MLKCKSCQFYILLFFISTFIDSTVAMAQAQFIQKCLGGFSEEQGSGIRETPDGGFIVCGFKESNNGDVACSHIGIDGWLVKLDGALNIQWQKCFSGNSSARFICLDITTDNGFIIGGETSGGGSTLCTGHGNTDYWIIKTDSLGNTLWQNCFGGSEDDRINDIHQTIDGGYILAGTSYSLDGDVGSGFGNGDFWILKLDSSGSILWNKTYGGFGTEDCFSISETPDHKYVACGRATFDSGDVIGTHGYNDCWVIKIDSIGNLIWQKALGGSLNDVAEDLSIDVNGDIVIIAEASSSDGDISMNYGGWDTWIVKLNSGGNIIWEKTYGGSSYDSGRSLTRAADGGYMLLSSGSSIDGDAYCSYGSQFWFTKIDSNGIFEFEKCLGGSDFDIPKRIISTTDSGFAAIGYTFSNDGDVSGNHTPCTNTLCTDMWVLKLNKELVSIDENLFGQIKFEVYPNPFYGFIILKTDVSRNIEINLHNSIGELVFKKNALTNQAINLSFLDDGIYFLDSPDLQFAFRMKIVKIGEGY